MPGPPPERPPPSIVDDLAYAILHGYRPSRLYKISTEKLYATVKGMSPEVRREALGSLLHPEVR